MMVDLGPESRRDSAKIRELYRDHLELLFLHEYADLEGALATGGLAPLPVEGFNLAPRLEGAHPIGEKDLSNQSSYVAARPSTIGCLMDLASRVRSAPVEVTSLVRHGEYQDALKRTNGNANTSIPMHTMGLAFDIALVNTPLETAYEIRDVLRKMRKAGDLLFIGERQQLVFHVVPHPSRLGHFSNVYAAAFGASPAERMTAVAAPAGPQRPTAVRPSVTVEIGAVLPADNRLAEEWWAAEVKTDAVTTVAAAARWLGEPLATSSKDTMFPAGPIGWACLASLPLLLAVAYGTTVRRSCPARLTLN